MSMRTKKPKKAAEIEVGYTVGATLRSLTGGSSPLAWQIPYSVFICGNCGAEYDTLPALCPKCGKPLKEPSKKRV
jgi:rubrerythrin